MTEDVNVDQVRLVNAISVAAARGDEVYAVVLGQVAPIRITRAYRNGTLVTFEDGAGHRTILLLSALLGVHMPLSTEWQLGQPEDN